MNQSQESYDEADDELKEYRDLFSRAGPSQNMVSQHPSSSQSPTVPSPLPTKRVHFAEDSDHRPRESLRKSVSSNPIILNSPESVEQAFKPIPVVANETSLEHDEDVERINEELNIFATGFKKEVTNSILHMKSMLMKRYQSKFQKFEQERDELINEYKTRLEKMQDSVNRRDNFLIKFKKVVSNMAIWHASLRERKNERELSRTIFQRWKEYSKQQKQKKKFLIFIEQNKERALLRKIIHEWKKITLNAKFENTRLVLDSKVNSITFQLRNDYEQKIESLERELELSQKRLSEETRDKVILQENLKKALMRGVCALNSKFLEIIKDANHPECEMEFNNENHISQNREPIPEKPPTMHHPPGTQLHYQQTSPFISVGHTGGSLNGRMHPNYYPHAYPQVPTSASMGQQIYQFTAAAGEVSKPPQVRVMREKTPGNPQPRLATSTRKRPPTPTKRFK